MTEVLARVLAVLGALALVVAAFLPWGDRGLAALDVGVLGWDLGRQPTVALVLVVVAALPAVSALVVGWAWPRLVAAVSGAALVLAWLASGAQAALTIGVWTALAGCVALLLSAGIAPPRRSVQAETSRRPANARPSVTSSA